MRRGVPVTVGGPFTRSVPWARPCSRCGEFGPRGGASADRIARSTRSGGSRDGGSASARVLHQAPDRPSDALVRAMGRHRTAGAGSGSSRTPLIHPAPFRAPRILLVVIGRRSASAPASPSRGPGNGILRAETGGRIQAQNAGEQSEFGSQTTLRLTNPPELRGFLSTRKPPRFVGTAWWGMQESN